MLKELIFSAIQPLVGSSPLVPNTYDKLLADDTAAVYTFAENTGVTMLWCAIGLVIMIWGLYACYKIYRPKIEYMDELKTKFKSIPQK